MSYYFDVEENVNEKRSYIMFFIFLANVNMTHLIDIIVEDFVKLKHCFDLYV